MKKINLHISLFSAEHLTPLQRCVTDGNLCTNSSFDPWPQQKLPWAVACLVPLRHGKRRQPGGEAGCVPDQRQPRSAAGETQTDQQPPEERLHPKGATQLPQHHQVGAAVRKHVLKAKSAVPLKRDRTWTPPPFDPSCFQTEKSPKQATGRRTLSRAGRRTAYTPRSTTKTAPR